MKKGAFIACLLWVGPAHAEWSSLFSAPSTQDMGPAAETLPFPQVDLSAGIPSLGQIPEDELSTAPPKQANGELEKNGCLSAIIDAEIQYEIPENLLVAIGLQESGRTISGKTYIWPWSVNAEGQGRFF